MGIEEMREHCWNAKNGNNALQCREGKPCYYDIGVEWWNSNSGAVGKCGQQHCWYGCFVCQHNGQQTCEETSTDSLEEENDSMETDWERKSRKQTSWETDLKYYFTEDEDEVTEGSQKYWVADIEEVRRAYLDDEEDPEDEDLAGMLDRFGIEWK